MLRRTSKSSSIGTNVSGGFRKGAKNRIAKSVIFLGVVASSRASATGFRAEASRAARYLEVKYACSPLAVVSKPELLNRFMKKLTRDRLCLSSREGLLAHRGDYSLGFTFLAEETAIAISEPIFSHKKSWSTKSSSYRMFRVSKYATNISENACSR